MAKVNMKVSPPYERDVLDLGTNTYRSLEYVDVEVEGMLKASLPYTDDDALIVMATPLVREALDEEAKAKTLELEMT